MVVITGYYVNLTETMARGTKVLLVATSDHLPSHPTTKDGRATDSCFTLIWGSCATLMSSNQGETAVCNSSILCWMTGEGDQDFCPPHSCLWFRAFNHHNTQRTDSGGKVSNKQG